jgi:hypothetical protein
MLPLCQINCAELPFKPDIFADIAYLTLFISEKLPIPSVPNGEGWLLRLYPNGTELHPIKNPVNLQSTIRPFPIRWELIEHDYPTGQHEYGSKIGGWPSEIQGEAFGDCDPKVEYIFQIDTEPKAHWGWGDSGTGYFGIQQTISGQQWIFDWQQY